MKDARALSDSILKRSTSADQLERRQLGASRVAV